MNNGFVQVMSISFKFNKRHKDFNFRYFLAGAGKIEEF